MFIYKLYELFNEACCACKEKGPHKQPVTEAKVNEVQAHFFAVQVNELTVEHTAISSVQNSANLF